MVCVVRVLLRALTSGSCVMEKRVVSTAVQLSLKHQREVSKSLAERDADIAEKEYREENYMEPDEPIQQVDADVEQYYRFGCGVTRILRRRCSCVRRACAACYAGCRHSPRTRASSASRTSTTRRS